MGIANFLFNAADYVSRLAEANDDYYEGGQGGAGRFEFSVQSVVPDAFLSCSACSYAADTMPGTDCFSYGIAPRNVFIKQGGGICATAIVLRVSNINSDSQFSVAESVRLIDASGRAYKGCSLCEDITPSGYMNEWDFVPPGAYGDFVLLFPLLKDGITAHRLTISYYADTGLETLSVDLRGASAECNLPLLPSRAPKLDAPQGSQVDRISQAAPQHGIKIAPEPKTVRSPERDLQKTCIDWFRETYPHLANHFFSVPNSQPDAEWRKILVEEGLVAGVADMLLSVPSGRYGCLGVEFKSPEGRLSPAQEEWSAAFIDAGNKYVVCRSFEKFQSAVNSYLSSANPPEAPPPLI